MLGLGAILLVSVLTMGSYAYTVNLSASTYEGLTSEVFDVLGGITINSQGFKGTKSNFAGESQPCTWADNGNCRTSLTKNNYEYSVILTIAAPVPAAATYTVEVQWDQSGTLVTMGTRTVTLAASETIGDTMTFKFDTGVTSFTAPLTTIVSVQ